MTPTKKTRKFVSISSVASPLRVDTFLLSLIWLTTTTGFIRYEQGEPGYPSEDSALRTARTRIGKGKSPVALARNLLEA
jgi:hypothetical protein